MDKYNHFNYVSALSDKLVWVNGFLRASSEEDPEDINTQISNLSGCVMVGVDGKDSEFDYAHSEVLNEDAMYCILILQQTESGNPNAVYASQEKCKLIARQVIARMMQDYDDMANGLQELIPASFQIHGIGPLGDCFHGVVLSYSVRDNMNYALNPEMWR